MSRIPPKPPLPVIPVRPRLGIVKVAPRTNNEQVATVAAQPSPPSVGTTRPKRFKFRVRGPGETVQVDEKWSPCCVMCGLSGWRIAPLMWRYVDVNRGSTVCLCRSCEKARHGSGRPQVVPGGGCSGK